MSDLLGEIGVQVPGDGLHVVGVGIDVEAVGRWTEPDERLFDEDEWTHCMAQAAPAESFAGTWCAKEAVVKAVFPARAIAVRDVRIARATDGSPAAVLPREYGLDVLVSISHTADVAVAIALAVARTW